MQWNPIDLRRVIPPDEIFDGPVKPRRPKGTPRVPREARQGRIRRLDRKAGDDRFVFTLYCPDPATLIIVKEYARREQLPNEIAAEHLIAYGARYWLEGLKRGRRPNGEPVPAQRPDSGGGNGSGNPGV